MHGVFVSCGWEYLALIGLVMLVKWDIKEIVITGQVEITTKKKNSFYILTSGKEYLAGLRLETFLLALDRGYLEKELYLLGSTMGNESLAKLKPNRRNNQFWRVWPVLCVQPGIINLKQTESLFPYPVNLEAQVDLGVLGGKVFEKLVLENNGISPKKNKKNYQKTIKTDLNKTLFHVRGSGRRRKSWYL